MKDYYLWFLIVFILIAGCVVSYKYGYGDGYKLGSSICPAIQHNYPHDQNVSDRPDGVMYPQQDAQAK